MRAVNRQPWFPRERLVETVCHHQLHTLFPQFIFSFWRSKNENQWTIPKSNRISNWKLQTESFKYAKIENHDDNLFFNKYFHLFSNFPKFHVHMPKFDLAISFAIFFLQADTCTIQIYTFKSQTEQKDSANELQNSEHRSKKQKILIVTAHDWSKLPPAVQEYCLKRYQLEGWTVSTTHLKVGPSLGAIFAQNHFFILSDFLFFHVQVEKLNRAITFTIFFVQADICTIQNYIILS